MEPTTAVVVRADLRRSEWNWRKMRREVTRQQALESSRNEIYLGGGDEKVNKGKENFNFI